MTPEEKTIDILRKHKVDFLGVLPCDRNKNLYDALLSRFYSVELGREEEGCGICAGAIMGGARPAMVIQNSGLGNMINALASLNRHYGFALPILMSWRGAVCETIEAQKWMGTYSLKIMEALDIPYHEIHTINDVSIIDQTLDSVYANNELRGYLFEPFLWTQSDFTVDTVPKPTYSMPKVFDAPYLKPEFTRYEMLQKLASELTGKAVVCNLGIPCKELYKVCHQKSNFYMLGSMGMVTPIALGMSLVSDKTVISIDGDGSVLMNPSTLATVAKTGPKNLIILCIDNGAYGSTGNQHTATSVCVDLAKVARGFGIRSVLRSNDPEEIAETLAGFKSNGPLFIHVICKAGNAQLPNLIISPQEIRTNVENHLKS